MLSVEIIGTLRQDHAEADKICSSDYLHFKRLVFSVCCSSLAQLLYASVTLSVYAKLSSHLHAVRERVAVNMQGTMFTLARLKILHTYHHELVSHPMPEHIEALS